MKFKKASLWVKLLVLVLVAYATVTLVALQPQIEDMRAEAERLSESKTALEQENQQIRDDIANMEADAGVVKIAREKLGMRFNGEIDFRDAGK